MLETITAFLSAIKGTTPVLLLGIAIASGVTLFSSDAVIARLGLVDVQKEYRPQIGLAFVLASSILVAQGVASAWLLVKTRIDTRRKRTRAERTLARLRETLHSLTPDEKAYLAPFVIGEANTLYFRIEDGISGGLVAKEILFRSSNIGSTMSGFAHNLQPWAREYLIGNPQLLEGASPKPTGGPPRW